MRGFVVIPCMGAISMAGPPQLALRRSPSAADHVDG